VPLDSGKTVLDAALMEHRTTAAFNVVDKCSPTSRVLQAISARYQPVSIGLAEWK